MRLRALFIIILITNLLYGCAVFRTCGSSADVSFGKQFDVNKKKVAILPFTNSGHNGLNYFASDQFAQGLMKIGFTIVERQQIQTIFSELKLEMSGTLSHDDMLRIGQLLHIDTLAFGSVDYSIQSHKTGTSSYANGITLRLVDIATGEVFLSGRCDYISNDIPWGIREICCNIKNKIHSEGR